MPSPRGLRKLAAVPVLTLIGCSAFSPQTIDTRPTYGFTKRAPLDPAGSGLYADLCAQQDRHPQCPSFYGLLPAAIDDADAARLRFLKDELSDSGAPRLVTAAALPLSAYAIYRGIFGDGGTVRRDAARAALGAGTAFTLVKNNESPTRQQIRLAAAEALSCAMHGSVARYLYTTQQISGVVDPDRPGGMEPALEAARRARDNLHRALEPLEQQLAATPETITAPGAYGNECDRQGDSNHCIKRGQQRTPTVVKQNAAHGVLRAEVQASRKALREAEDTLGQVAGLKDRIDGAPLALLAAVRQIESGAAKAVLATEADVETLRKSVTGLRLAAQDLGLPAPATAASQPLPGQVNAPATAQSRLSDGSTGTARGIDRSGVEAARLEAGKAAMWRRAVETRTRALKAFLDMDRQRAERVRALADCQFTPPGLKLQVDPQNAVTLTPGSAIRYAALGGTELPTVGLAGSTALTAAETLKTEPDNTDGRRTLSVVFTAPATAADQQVTLVFRNGDLVVQRELSIRKAAGGAK